jgi:urease accessory protein
MRALVHIVAGRWDHTHELDRLHLDYDQRHRRRGIMKTEGGREILLDLSQAVILREGDALQTEEGTLIRVCAQAEAVLDITAPPGLLLRIAWHLGNRHLPVQCLENGLRCRADHVIAEMLLHLGAEIVACEAPFDPEPGAYAAPSHAHHHD